MATPVLKMDILQKNALDTGFAAAYEVMIGTIINQLFFGAKVSRAEVAQIGQYVENVFFGKPCGLMDQTASAVGNLITIPV